MHSSAPHRFHIPVMGLAYTIDTPMKVARFGISSVLSIVEDHLIEMMRSYYYPLIKKEYKPISIHEPDYRAKRITDYLDLVYEIVEQQMEHLRSAAFESGSDIVKYFEMLPDDSTLKILYRRMLSTTQPEQKNELQSFLRSQVKAGSIDVNIMTKADRDRYTKENVAIEFGSDAISALRAYANSKIRNSSIVFSAGLNPRLYNYLEHLSAFDIQEDGSFNKRIIVKVSDYRSAIIQGKYLAKKGIWVSEFRIESGLNCGGHAFATEGQLMGPILEEFKANRRELQQSMFELYHAAQVKKGKRSLDSAPPLSISAQGGIGTCEESEFLHRYYQIDSAGWGTPFLLVPEATTVDDHTLGLLCHAKADDLILSHNSPLGVRFYYLKGTTAEEEKNRAILQGKPGVACTEKHLAFNTEFTKEGICAASRTYQKLKLEQLQRLDLSVAEYEKRSNEIMQKECLCVGLSNAAALRYNLSFLRKRKAVNICPGPNIVHFSKVSTLEDMIAHIYGRKNIISSDKRPHMFIAELKLYLDFLREQLEEDVQLANLDKKAKYYSGFIFNLFQGITYYRDLKSISHSDMEKDEFHMELNEASDILHKMCDQYALEHPVVI